MHVIKRHIANVFSNHANGNTSDSIFSVDDIYVSFVPDEVIIKNVCFYQSVANDSVDKIVYLKSDRISGVMIAFPTGDAGDPSVVINTENHFILEGGINVNGKWTFTLINGSGELANIAGDLNFSLEFI